MKKTILSISTASLLLGGIFTGVHASTEQAETKASEASAIEKGEKKKHKYRTLASRTLIKNEPIRESTTDDMTFNVPDNYEWAKVYIKNDGPKEIHFSVVHSKNKNKELMEGDIPAGKSKSFYNWEFSQNKNGFATGDHIISLSCGDAKMKGEVSVRVGTEKADLK